MDNSTRVNVILELAARMQYLKWPEADLLLRQFGLSWSDSWSGSLYEYLLHHLEASDESALVNLHEHFFPSEDSESEVETVPSGQWSAGRFRLFITHVISYRHETGLFKTELKEFAIDAFVAHDDIEVTSEWETEIRSALTSCHGMVALLSDGFRESDWTAQEVGFCIGRRVLIIPIKVDLNPYGFLAKTQALTKGGKPESALAAEVFDILIEHNLTAEKMATAVLRQFDESNSFAGAKRNLSLVKKIKNWTPEMLRQIEEAVERNPQIGEAWDVPEGVRRIVGEHGR